MPTSVGARGSYLLEDVTVISTELVRLYRLYRLYGLVGLCRLLSSLTGLNRLSGLLSRRGYTRALPWSVRSRRSSGRVAG